MKEIPSQFCFNYNANRKNVYATRDKRKQKKTKSDIDL